MTPEERAKFCASLFLDPAKVSSEKRSRVEREIAVSIRAAVMAEQEALLSLVKRWAALDGSLWHSDRYYAEKARLVEDTQTAIRARTP